MTLRSAAVDTPSEFKLPVTFPVTFPVVSPVTFPVTFPVTLPDTFPNKVPENVVEVIIPDALMLPAELIPTPLPLAFGFSPTCRAN